MNSFCLIGQKLFQKYVFEQYFQNGNGFILGTYKYPSHLDTLSLLLWEL